MKKILIVSTVSRQFYLFEQGNIEILKSLGYEVHAAANFSDANVRLDALDIIRHHFDIERLPFSLKNIKAYMQLKRLMKSERFDAVHCHSPMGGVLARLAAKAIGISPIIYTAHGFHFYKGAPLINWLAYYPVERFLSKYTNILITINQEDFMRAKKFTSETLINVPGIGVDTEKYSTLGAVDKGEKCRWLDIPTNASIILSVGELNNNKNHEVIIKAIAMIEDPNVFYLICGQGDREDYLKQMTKSLGISDRVKFLGYRNDVSEIYNIANIFAFPSYREGLSVSLMEAMTSCLPVICSNIRGNKDLIKDGDGGYLVEPADVKGFAIRIDTLLKDVEMQKTMGNRNYNKVKKFDKEVVKRKMKNIYGKYL